MRVRHDAIDEQPRSVARRSRAEVLSTPAVFKGLLAALIVALGLTAAASEFIADAHGLRANDPPEASQDCSARYAALLDLAELARRDGKSSEIVVRGLSGHAGAMSACLPASRSEPVPQ
ncbi:hypothetical protein B0G69_4592 [Paraburkholderia sp. RAU2J]|uniref:hypothetical protein n=1 Tax=Paraburkholderia sp. RAU2J TaxID=1938810 RepID=UPI000EAC879E|nr:hypothetical protein [Paraburkholderia sp. RAU2J]RKT21216.1 hypothetical protein B0G69_4592 [Paraburkholderia sp. RAU2J]